MRKKRVGKLLLCLLLLTVLLLGCADEKEVQWTPVRNAARTEKAADSLGESAEAVSTADLPQTAAAETDAPISTTDHASATEAATSVPAEESSAFSSEQTESTEETLDRVAAEHETELTSESATGELTVTYIANIKTKKFHYPDCSSVSDMKESNKLYFTGTRDELIEQGYQPCKRCKP